MLQAYRWTLLSADTLALRIQEAAPADLSDEEALFQQAKHQYTLSLYKACCQSHDSQRRERAYRDLHHYLYRAAYNRWPELAEDATQRALVLIYEQIEHCHQPDTFLAFALWKLRHAFQQEERARRTLQEDKALAAEVGQNRSRRPTPPSGKRQFLKEERTTILIQALQSLSDPRKRQAIVLKYFVGLSDADIAQQLDVTANYVRVLRHRGMQELRENRRLRRYFNIEAEEGT